MTPPTRVDAGDAASIVVSAMVPRPTEVVSLAASLGRTLATDLVAPFASPPWTNAAMDGYAARAADVRGATSAAPRSLRIIGATRAGGGAVPALGSGEALRIFTGAEVPTCADSVIRQEDTRVEGERVLVLDDRDALTNVRGAGGDVAEGATALVAGTTIWAGQVAMLAVFGVTLVTVYQQPRVGILVTGDELVATDDHDAINSGRFLADVNGPMLSALVTRAGGTPIHLGIAPDDPHAIRDKITAAPPIDLLLTSGGVSVGDHDHLPAVMQSLGAHFNFRRVRIRPGGPASFGILPDGLAWLGLPGNPVSSFVTFTLFGHPAVRALAGARRPYRTISSVTVSERIRQDRALDVYLRVILSEADPGQLRVATPTGAQGSGMMSSIAAADALLRIPAGDGMVSPGEVLEAIEL